MAKVFNKEDCLKWFQNPNINPKTGHKINVNAKSGIFKDLQKQCTKYKVKPIKEKSISPADKSISDDKKQLINVKKIKYNDINYLKEFAVHTEKPIEIVENLDQSMLDACPNSKQIFNKAYFQYFVGQYISKRTPYNNLLLFYTVGTGKTCAAVSIAESILIGHNNFEEPPIIVILPRTLMQNFKDTIYDLHKQNINQCSENTYKFIDISSNTQLNQLIAKRYNIMTYSGFVNYCEKNTIQNKTIIIDEAHNLRNPDEIDDEKDNKQLKKIYETVENAITNGKNNRLILMSGTPMFNESSEIKDLLNLFLINDGKTKITKMTDDLLAKLSTKYISYINSKNPFVYPIRISHEDAVMRDNTPDGIINVTLNKSQEKYGSGSKIINNIKYMNITYKPDECFSQNNNKYKSIGNIKVLNETNIATYAPKISKIMDYVKKSTGIVIIYSTFIEYGILQLALALEYLGYSRFVEKSSNDFNLLDDPTIIKKSKLRYAMIASENNQFINNVGSSKNISNILSLINSDDNIYGKQLKVLLITKKASEGLSIFNVREIHILDPWYHFNRHEQIIGRGFRRCSHINLPINLRNISIFVYRGIFENKSKISPDEHAYNIAIEKFINTKHYISIIEKNAFDNRINEKLNIFPQSLFKKVNPVKITTSQNNERDFYLGQKDKEYTTSINNDLLDDNNIREETMFLSNRYVNIIKELMKNKDYVSYQELLLKCNDKRYLDLAINNVIFPNKIANYLLIFNNDGIQKIIDNPNKEINEIALTDNEPLNTSKTNNYDIDVFENKYEKFELLYRFLMYINDSIWDDIAIDIIQNKTKYTKLYNILVDHSIIVDNNYFDLFNSDKPPPLKDINKNIINIDKYTQQTVKSTDLYGNIGLIVKSKGILTKNLIFKVVSGKNRGTNCMTESATTLNKILKDDTSNNKLNKCIKIAEKFYNEGNLLIIPYIKMKK